MSDNETPRQMPKGGRKGGTQFPQLNLKAAEEYAKKLVSKTHTGPQPASVILKGVFGASGPTGQVRASALKQYGLIAGQADAYEASEPAKALAAAPPDEAKIFRQEAFFRAKVFKSLYDTFVSDTVSRAKIRQQAAQLDVHPDSLEKATQLFVEGAVFAGLAIRDGENVTILRRDAVPPAPQEFAAEDNGKDLDDPEEPSEVEDAEVGAADTPENNSGKSSSKGRAAASVTFKVDSSMDTDKLEKQLKLLRKFGVI